MIRPDSTLGRSGTALLVILVVLAPLSVAPIAAQQSSAPPTPEQITIDGQPSFVVYLSDAGTLSDLQTWVEEDPDRTLQRVGPDQQWAVVSGPRAAAVSLGPIATARAAVSDPGVLLEDALSSRSFVEAVHPNLRHQRLTPRTNLLAESQYEAPSVPLLQRNPLGDAKAANPSGIAFSGDANRTTMAESRDITGTDNVSTSGQGVRVAVIDTGANTANGRIFGNGTDGSDIRIDPDSKDFVDNETVRANDLSVLSDGNGHGTWVASAIAANASGTVHDGIAPDAQLLVLRALDDEGSGSTADIAAAVRYAVDNDADVISMSLGSPVYDPTLADALQYAEDNGVPVVVAAGNSRQTTRWVGSPADADAAITVAATNGEAPSDAESAYFSQVGPDPGTTDGSSGATEGARVDVAAPGMSTVARVPTTTGAVTNSTLSGTSMATPMVAAGVANYLEANPDATTEDVRTWVREGARPIPSAGETEVGAGMLSVDLTVAEDAPAEDQDEARTTEAEQRDRLYRALSDSQGGPLAGLLPDIDLPF